MKEQKILKTAGIMAIATLLAKLCGLIRDSLIAGYFGTGFEADAFITASKLPTMLFDMVLGGVITASFIPIFNGILEKENRERAIAYANRLITVVFTITVLLSVFGILFSDRLIGLLAPEFTGEKFALSSKLSAIMFPMIIFTGLAYSFVGILQSFGEFNIPSVISLISNAVLIAYFPLFGEKFGVLGLAVAMLVAWSLQVLVQIPSLKKFKVKIRPDFRFFDSDIKATLKLAGPMLVSTWVQPLYSIINSRFASGIDGAPTVLELANRLYLVMVGVFSFVVTNLIFPKLARANASDNYDESKEIITTSLKAIILVVLPLSIGFIILSKPITSIIYEHNNFTENDVFMVSTALKCYSVGMVGFAVNEILSKFFFSLKDSKTPMRNSVISMIFNIALAYVLFEVFKTPGLAMAAALGSIISALLNAFSISRRFKGMFLKEDFKSIFKIAISAAVMGGTAYVIYTLLSPYLYGTVMGKLMLCAGCAIASGAVYFTACYITKVDVFVDTINSFLKKKERQ